MRVALASDATVALNMSAPTNAPPAFATHTLTQAHSLWVCVVTALSIRAISKRVPRRSAPDTDLASLHANTNHNKHHLCKVTRRSRASHNRSMTPLCSLDQFLKDASAPHKSATAVIAASNAHPLPCSATVVDTSDDANNHKSSLKHARTALIAGPMSLPLSSPPPIYFST
jgi:hypothetical protein